SSHERCARDSRLKRSASACAAVAAIKPVTAATSAFRARPVILALDCICVTFFFIFPRPPPGDPASRTRPMPGALPGRKTPVRCETASEHLEDTRCAHSSANAHRHADALCTAALAFDEGVTGEALAAHAVGMAHRDGAAVDVQAVHRDAQLVGAIEHLHGEGLVELPQVDVVDAEAQTLEHLGHREHRTDAHLVGLAARDGEAEEAAQRLEALALGERIAHHDAGAGAVAELAGIARADHAAGNRGADVLDGVVGGARAQAFVLRHRDLLAAQAHDRVGDAGGHGDGNDLVLELAGFLRGDRLLLAGRAVLVHALAADAVALGNGFGGLQHRPVDLGLVLLEPAVHEHVHVHLLLHAGDALHAAG